MIRKVLLAVTAGLMLAMPVAHANEGLDPAMRSAARRAIDAGLMYLRGKQGPDGSVEKNVGFTALALRAFLESPRGYNEGDGPFITKQVEFLLANARDDGSISESLGDSGYKTAVAIAALAATKNPKYDAVIEKGRKFLTLHQIDETEGYTQEHRYFGGFGYGGDQRPDLSNTYIALEALKAASLDAKDPAWQKALLFVSRSQNRSESNDQKWAGNDGGFVYRTGTNPEQFQIGETASYGSMTAAGLLSLLYAGLDKNDPRIQAAYKWIQNEYSLDVNPGTDKKDALFYFYNAYAKVMRAMGEPTFVDGKGQRRNWRNELVSRLVSMQNTDGSWINRDSKLWGESSTALVTCWAVLALENAYAK